ncbi:acyl carrier protein [Streptomyces sp. NPDC088760]|uniref:acyl carrier protein n=1 Tax=Streptomyces sp. NPDC088760 TaxID=3365890 RepID=UPI0037F5D719
MAEAEVLDVVAGIWKEVLLTDVGPDSDFFEEGGHSLAVLQLVSRLNEHYGVELSMRDIFDHPTLGEFAGAVRERVAAA